MDQQAAQVEQFILEDNKDEEYNGYQTASSDEDEDEDKRREVGIGQKKALISEFSRALASEGAKFFVEQDGSSSSELSEAEYVADTPPEIAHGQFR
ncbi:UNVERIFIED_CONTAM: hypothetical protein HDU68_002995 [Siphonaria sp. JEL0065]|nr:hypothetical protein HDU68_002995 [Siphonaria sp. JEL0065]